MIPRDGSDYFLCKPVHLTLSLGAHSGMETPTPEIYPLTLMQAVVCIHLHKYVCARVHIHTNNK